MSDETVLNRRTLLASAAGVTAAGLLGRAAPALSQPESHVPLWRTAWRRGLIYGTAVASWQLPDSAYAHLVAQQAALLTTQDDLLWFTLKPTPTSDLDFTLADEILAFAEQNGQLLMGGFLVWDEGFGDGWTDDDLWGLDRAAAEQLLYGTAEAVVSHYRGRVPVWLCCNEVVGTITTEGNHGLRTDVPWYNTIGPQYVAESFRVAHAADPDALLVLNDFGTETDSEFGDSAERKRSALLKILDELLADGVPVHGLGIQAHLIARHFEKLFDPRAYRRWLAEVADRGLKILITELDVLDDGLPIDRAVRNAGVADVYKRYLDVALSEPAVIVVNSFGLSDRYTSQDEDNPRDDGAPRLALPWNSALRTKAPYDALREALQEAPTRTPYWTPPRAARTRSAARRAYR